MPKIHQLSHAEAQKIAAGQVVERPAHALKELIENSIDAGSTRIDIYIEQAGQKLIRVIDNGCGMSVEDAQRACNRHATSKIQHIDQLPHITTFGFRGEALASIAAVSTLTLITQEKQAGEGIKIIRSSELVDIQPASCNPGTDISIENLFYNVPARKKFLKKELTEWRQIQGIVQAFCLSYPGIHIKLYNDKKMVYNCPPTDTYQERMAQLWDTTLSKNSIELATTTQQEITIEGAITNQQYYRYDRGAQFLFVNKRWIKNQDIAKAVFKGYMNVLPPARYPCVALMITVNPLEVDVNVHPRKEEVAFIHPRRIETLLTQTIQAALEQHLSTQLINSTLPLKKTSEQITPVTPKQHYTRPMEMESAPLSWHMQRSITPFIQAPAQQITLPTAAVEPLYTTNNMVEESALTIEESALTSDAYIIGQLHKTYILLEHEDGLFMVDQHAAHERILYERFKEERFTAITTVELLFPISMHMAQEQLTLLEPYLEAIHTHGLHLERLGTHQLVIKATPIHAKNVNFNDLITEIIGWITETDLEVELFTSSLHEKITAQMACKAAVKAGDTLSDEHMQQLIKDLSQTKNRFICAHGRPTGWLLSRYEMEKKFKRKL